MFDFFVVRDALRIDQFENRWLSRSLFLFVFFLTAAYTAWPLGNPDISATTDWLLSLYKSESFRRNLTFTIPPDVIGNLIFTLSGLLFTFVLLFFVMYEMTLYCCDKKKMTLRSILKLFFSRLPLLFILLALFFFFTLFPLVNIVIYAWGIPAFFLSPALLIFDRMNPIDALIYSYRSTKGLRLRIFFSVFSLYIFHSFLQNFAAVFFSGSRAGWALIYGFLRAFFLVAAGRLWGIMYEKLLKSSIHL